MPTYEVTYKAIEIYVVKVEADSEEEAEGMVFDMHSSKLDNYHYDSDSEFVVYELEDE